MAAELEEIKLEPLAICGIMGTALIPLCQYNMTKGEERHVVVQEILTELASKEVVIMGNTLVYTEGFDGFRVL
ncbi:hypothetical protein EKK58_08065 [Candidatus Dependentiae bacterium]|nr:MAG: hypothetical protein EKK58_08065 [Candidatus Dependentiae bacterium]